MMQFDAIHIEQLQSIINFLIKNRENFKAVLEEFGDVKNDNGYGTFFLNPKNKIFRTFWVYIKDQRIESVGFGGEKFGLFLNDLLSFYGNFKEGFNRYDDEYIYSFYSGNNYTHVITISSPITIKMEDESARNVAINALNILLN